MFGNLLAAAHSDWWYGTTSWSYVIDGFDRRVGRKVNNVLTDQWLYDSENRIIAELDGSGNLLSEFVYATHSHAPDLMIRGGTVYVFVHDQLGSPLMIISSSGVTAQKRNYEPFGAIDEFYTLGGFSQPFGFAGGLYDPNIGYRFGARDMNPWLGRWYSKDQARFGGGTNFYTYAENDPVNLIDPEGYWPREAWEFHGQAVDGYSVHDATTEATIVVSGLVGEFIVGTTLAAAVEGGIVTVTSWAPVGVEATIGSGRWVMLGGNTLRNWLWAGLVGLNYPIANSVTQQVARSSLRWPAGWEFLKGIFGQRVCK